MIGCKVPKCYGSGTDGAQRIIILEDLIIEYPGIKQNGAKIRSALIGYLLSR